MNDKKGIFSSTYDVVLLGVFTAILIVLAFTPLGYLRIGIISISLLAIPVAVCACYLGKWGGLILGTVFGLTSFFQCFGLDLFGTAMFSVNGFYCFVVCVVSRAIMGFLAGLIADILINWESKKKRHVRYLITCISAPLLNTVFFCGLLALLFHGVKLHIGDGDVDVIKGVVIPAISLNSVVEIAAGCIIGTAICEALYPIAKRARK